MFKSNVKADEKELMATDLLSQEYKISNQKRFK